MNVGSTAATPEDVDSGGGRVVSRPDGYHWIAPDGRQEFGPFESVQEAVADMEDAAQEGEPAPGETLQEAEDEVGVSGWIDPETGELAEGQSPPHLGEE